MRTRFAGALLCVMAACTRGPEGGEAPAPPPPTNGAEAEELLDDTPAGPAAEATELDCPDGTERVLETEQRAAWCARADGTRHGPILWWRDDGDIQRRGAYEDGQRHGEWQSFESDGSLYNRVRYRNGRLHGHQVWFRRDGTVSSESHYLDGRYHGTHINYDLDGNHRELNEYVHGQRVLRISYERGEEVSRTTFDLWTPQGEAATRSHPEIPTEWQACTEDHECVLTAWRCCPCGAESYVAVHHHHEGAARDSLRPSCDDVRCPAMRCMRVGGRCDDGRCVSAH